MLGQCGSTRPKLHALLFFFCSSCTWSAVFILYGRLDQTFLTLNGHCSLVALSTWKLSTNHRGGFAYQDVADSLHIHRWQSMPMRQRSFTGAMCIGEPHMRSCCFFISTTRDGVQVCQMAGSS
ncbi:hypothetical protein EDB19DRAFT_1742764 [Suillus lakei]|nr:hypothetical protein EDB19DRAFT_1742764 [Suillus lakei]